MPKALYILGDTAYGVIYKAVAEQIASLVDVYAPPQTSEVIDADPAVLADMEIMLSGWKGPRVDERFLAAAPRLKAVFYGAGSIRATVSDAFWDRGITICSAWGANGIPVAEYTIAQIVLLLKKVWHYALRIKREKAWGRRIGVPGAYGSTVGIISLSLVGRRVCELLRPFDLKIVAYDPYAQPQTAKELNVELVSLADIFRRSDVVSLHTPWLKETEGLITGEHFRMMKHDAAFLNTARGAVVRQNEMIEVLRQRPDLWAVLDVTHPEPPEAGSPLYELPNVVLTPHIAGPVSGESRRQGEFMLSELKRYLAGQPLQWQVTREKAAIMA
ncbi:MAG TPA: hydroxyacid dehydrogenase [Phycisphaerae bacterium]|nr:hydroxyacid dehydrogenase [Phycisphaerae bacterium]HUT61404.1 hydroxyacid dehydrogenase [Phycisphaerae bacterium]